MLKVKAIAQGRCKESWLAEALAEYEKRLKGRIEIEWIIVDTPEELAERASKEPRLIALDLKGDLLSSEDLSRRLYTSWGSRIAFAIGGPDGLPSPLKPLFRWSLSPLTFTHQIVRLLLAEQLYRAAEIERGSSYHK
jgi:23S rRNA (pseudouridine1915-N3)-methyltransferase